MDHFRIRRVRLQKKSFLAEIFGDKSLVSPSYICDKVMSMFTDLPHRFKETPPITFDPKEDRFGFQSANIVATVQLLRMVLFTAQGATVGERCQIASEVVDAFITIPVGYLNAISSPLLYHLEGIGSILGSVFEEPLSEPKYLQVRSVLLAMAQLLAHLDITIRSTGVASERLRSQVARIDEYMATQRALFGKEQPLAEPTEPVRSGSASSYYETGSVNTPHATSGPTDSASLQASQFQLPAELLEDWPWVFDFGQPID